MKKQAILLLLIISLFQVGFYRDAFAVSQNQKRVIGVAVAGAGAWFLWKCYEKMRHDKLEGKRGVEKENEVKVALSSALTVGGLSALFSSIGMDRPESINVEYGSDENIILKNGQVDFFHTVMGFDEKVFAGMSLEARRHVINEIEETGKVQFGEFHEISINDLRNETDALTPFKKRGRFERLIGAQVDVKELQAAPRYNGATFQVASNFNCLEGGTCHGDHLLLNEVLRGKRVPQGQHASRSAFPGAIKRRYFYSEICLIDDLDSQEVVQATASGRAQLVLDVERLAHSVGLIKVGVHSDILVTHGANDRNVINQGQHINQVLVSALPVRRSWNEENAKAMAQPFLNAAYEGTMRAAALCGSQTVVLTLVGGGVFGNRLSWIAEAIENSIPFARRMNMNIVLVCRMDSRDLGKNLTQNERDFLRRIRHLCDNYNR